MFTRSSDPPAEQRSISLADPGAVSLFSGMPSLSGVSVTETSAMGLSAVYACVQLLSGTIATLPMRTVLTKPDGGTERSTSFLDDPADPGDPKNPGHPADPGSPNAFEWAEDLMLSLLLRGNYFALKIRGGAGQLLALQAIPPSCVGIDVKNGRKVYRVQLDNGGTKDLTDYDILHIRGMSLDGIRGVSPITIARQSLGTAIAGERSAARLFSNGALMSAIVTPTEMLSPEDQEKTRDALSRMVGGESNAGSIVVLNKGFNISQWSVDPVDAQFLESRKFSVAEIARWFRVPPHMVGDVERSTSWGSGLEEQVLGFQRFVLQPWTSRIEAALSRLLSPGLKVEFDYRQLIAGSPADEIDLLIAQAGGPFRTVNEVRAIQNLPPIEGGDVLAWPLKHTQPQEIAA